MTGLTDEQRADFRLTSSLSQWTRMDPSTRAATLMKLSSRLTGQQDIRDELKSWNMEFSPKLMELKGRLLPPEQINLRTKVSYQSSNADWTRDVQVNVVNTSWSLQPTLADA